VEQHCTEIARAWPLCAPSDAAIRRTANPITNHAMPSHSSRDVSVCCWVLSAWRSLRHAAGDAAGGFRIDPVALTALRTAIAGLCSLALLLILRRPLPPRALWPQLVIRDGLRQRPVPLLMAMGMQTVDASHGGVVLGILPIATALVAVAITHERPRPLFWIASLAGAALVIAFALRQGGGALSTGDLLLFAAVAVSAIGYAFSGRLTAEMPGWEVTPGCW